MGVEYRLFRQLSFSSILTSDLAKCNGGDDMGNNLLIHGELYKGFSGPALMLSKRAEMPTATGGHSIVDRHLCPSR
jgi:hypothetical protein